MYKWAGINAGNIAERNEFHDLLGGISNNHYWYGLPMLSVIVVSKNADGSLGMPGNGFFELARYLNPDYMGVSDVEIWIKEHKAVEEHRDIYQEILTRHVKGTTG